MTRVTVATAPLITAAQSVRGFKFIKNVAALFADTEYTYQPGRNGTVVPGDTIVTLEEGFSYDVIAAGASTPTQTAGGVKLRALAELGALEFEQFGAAGDGVTDDQAAIEATIEAARVRNLAVRIGAKTYAHSGVIEVPGAVAMLGNGTRSVFKALAGFPATYEVDGYHFSGTPRTFPAPQLWLNGMTNTGFSHRTAKDFVCDGSQVAPIGILVSVGANWGVTNVGCQDHVVTNMVIDGCQNSVFTNLRARRCEGSNIAVFNGVRQAVFNMANTRIAGTWNLETGMDANFPGYQASGTGAANDYIQINNGPIEDEFSGTKAGVAHLQNLQRSTFRRVQFVVAGTNIVTDCSLKIASSCTDLVFEGCRIRHGANTVPAIKQNGFNVDFRRFSLLSVGSSGTPAVNAIEVTGRTLFEWPDIDSTVFVSGKVLADTAPGTGTNATLKLFNGQDSGTTGQRPDLSQWDAVYHFQNIQTNRAEFWDWRSGGAWYLADGTPLALNQQTVTIGSASESVVIASPANGTSWEITAYRANNGTTPRVSAIAIKTGNGFEIVQTIEADDAAVAFSSGDIVVQNTSGNQRDFHVIVRKIR